MIKDVKVGKMVNVFNAQRDGSLIMTKYVKKLMIFVENGLQMENVKNVIKVMSQINKEFVKEIKINLFQMKIAYVKSGKGECV